MRFFGVSQETEGERKRQVGSAVCGVNKKKEASKTYQSTRRIKQQPSSPCTCGVCEKRGRRPEEWGTEKYRRVVLAAGAEKRTGATESKSSIFRFFIAAFPVIFPPN